MKKLSKMQLIKQKMEIMKERLRDVDGRVRSSNTHLLSFRGRKPSECGNEERGNI